MKQLIQNFKSGELYVDELPMPSLSRGMVLVENRFSLISAGTERSTVQVAKANLLGKARQRPDLVAQVLNNIRKEGFSATLKKVQTRLDTLKPLGYSAAGTVLASLDTDGKFLPGDRVACAGQGYASHAEVICVPQNLVVKIPDSVAFEEAAFTTLGAIALQGVRQAEPRLGEKVCVIGLGLLGQLTGQLLRSNGCDVFGIDLSPSLVTLANEVSVSTAMLRSDDNLLSAIDYFTDGQGFDSVIITAAAPTNDPILLATEVCRRKARIVVVGAVKMDVPREPHFYRKELELRISCSYGPGRYDSTYEEGGADYPFAYVRWTEQRNMQAFLEAIAKNAVHVKPLTTHTFEIANAEKAYDIVTGKLNVPHLGILISYSDNVTKYSKSVKLQHKPIADINVAFIGAGNFAQSYLIPNVRALGGSMDTVVTTKGITARSVATKFGFSNCSTDLKEVLSNPGINTVFIATPHASHAGLVIQALQASKNVFVEKPLAITYEELDNVIQAKAMHPHHLLVGFNRRFSHASATVKKHLGAVHDPVVVNIRVNAGAIQKDHWIQNSEIGGGRIIGEICHFIDLMQFFTEAEPVKVYASCVHSSNDKIKADDNIAVTISFSNGSIGQLLYVANGDRSLPKEHIEIFYSGKAAVINDFQSCCLYKDGNRKIIKSAGKGHFEEIDCFFQSLKNDGVTPIDFRSVCLTTLTTLKIADAIRTNLPQEILL